MSAKQEAFIMNMRKFVEDMAVGLLLFLYRANDMKINWVLKDELKIEPWYAHKKNLNKSEKTFISWKRIMFE